MAKFKLKLLTFQYNHNQDLIVLDHIISNFTNIVTNEYGNNKGFLESQKSYCYSFDEKVSIKENSQKTLNFSMLKNVTREDRIEQNPFVNELKIGSQLLLEDKYQNQFLFTILKINFDFQDQNIIYHYECQDSFTYNLSRQNAGYKIDNDPSKDSFLGAHDIDWWVLNKIDPECYITYHYIPLTETLKIKYNKNMESELSTTDLTSQDSIKWKIWKPAYNVKDYPDFFKTFSFSGSGTADSILIQLGDMVGLQLNTHEELVTIKATANYSYKTLKCYYWFSPKKTFTPSGLKYSPTREIKDFSLEHEGTALSSIINVNPIQRGEKLLTLLPPTPSFFKEIFMSDDWLNSFYYNGFYQDLCSKSLQILDNNVPLQTDIKAATSEGLQYNTTIYSYYEGKRGILCVPLRCLVEKNHQFFLTKTFYDFFSFSDDNKESYIEYSTPEGIQILYDTLNNWKLWLPENQLSNYTTIESIQKECFQADLESIPTIKREAALTGAFIVIDVETDFAGSSYKFYEYKIIFKWYRNPTQEEQEFAYIADHCPWLENKIINFDYFRKNHMITIPMYQQLMDLFNNKLRIINGRLLCYNDLYYNNLQSKVELLSKLKSDIDNLGSFFQHEYIDSFINNGIVRDNSHFVEQYEHMFNTINKQEVRPLKYLMDYDTIYSKYLNQYIDAEQRFLKNMYKFQNYFESKNNFSETLYPYQITIKQTIENQTDGDLLYSFDQKNIATLTPLDDSFKMYIQDIDSDDYGKPLTQIYLKFGQTEKTKSQNEESSGFIKLKDDQILWKSKFNSNPKHYWVLNTDSSIAAKNFQQASGPYDPNLTYFIIKNGHYVHINRAEMIKSYKNKKDNYSKFLMKDNLPLVAFNFDDWKGSSKWLMALPQAQNLPFELQPQDVTDFYYKHVPISNIQYKYVGEKGEVEYWPTILINGENAREFFRPIESNSVTDNFNSTNINNLNDVLTQVNLQQGLVFKKEGYTTVSLDVDTEGNYIMPQVPFQDFPTDNHRYYTNLNNPNLNLLRSKTTREEFKEYATTFLHTIGSMKASKENNNYFYKTYFYKPLKINDRVYKNRQYVICLNLTESDCNNINNMIKDNQIDMVKYYPLRTKCNNINFQYFDNRNAKKNPLLEEVLQAEKIITDTLKDTIYFKLANQTLSWMIMEVVNVAYKTIPVDQAATINWYDAEGFEVDVTQLRDFTNEFFIAKDLKENIYIQAEEPFNIDQQYFIKDSTSANETYTKIWTINNMKLEGWFSYQPDFSRIIYLPQIVNKHKVLINQYVYQDNKYIFKKKDWQEFSDEDQSQNKVQFKLIKIDKKVNISAKTNGEFWYKFHDNENEVVRLEAIRIETELNKFWEQAYNASKQCNFFLPPFWQSYRDYQVNPFFKDLFALKFETEKNEKEQVNDIHRISNGNNKELASITVKHHFIPAIKMLKRPHFNFIYTEHRTTNDPLAKSGEEKLEQVLISNDYLTNVFRYLIPDVNKYQFIEAIHNEYKDTEAYYVPDNNTGCSWYNILASLSETGQDYKYFGGWNDVMIKCLQYAGYTNLSNTKYEEYKIEHNAIWNNIYQNYPNLILEKQYEPDESAVSERDVLNLSLNAVKDYSNIERKYSISLIDSASIHGYQGQELKIGECIELEADALYPEWDDIKNSLRQYLFISELSYPLRSDGDVTVTVDDIKYQDKLIRDLVKLIR